MMKGQLFYCNYCKETRQILKNGDARNKLSVDHFLAKLHGGNTHHQNQVICCQRCNTLKGQTVFNSIEAVQEFISKKTIFNFIEKVIDD